MRSYLLLLLVSVCLAKFPFPLFTPASFLSSDSTGQKPSIPMTFSLEGTAYKVTTEGDINKRTTIIPSFHLLMDPDNMRAQWGFEKPAADNWIYKNTTYLNMKTHIASMWIDHPTQGKTCQ